MLTAAGEDSSSPARDQNCVGAFPQAEVVVMLVETGNNVVAWLLCSTA